MIRSKKALDKLIEDHYAVQRKKRLKNVFRTLAEIGLFAAASVGSAGAEPIYYYTGNTETGAAGDEEKWQDADGKPVTGIIIRTEGTANEYRFLSGIYDGKQTSGEVWLIGDNKDVRIISSGPLTIRNWGTGGLVPNQGVITAANGKIIFGNDVSILDNYSSGFNTKGGGALYSGKGIVFGDNARVVHNQTALPIGGPYFGGGAIYLDGSADSEVVFGKNALVERNEANYGGAIYALGSVSFGESTIIRENRSSSQGGAIHIKGTLTLKSASLVESNKANGTSSTTYGGAFFIDGGSADISGTTIRNNETAATGWGGAIYVQNGSVRLSNGTLVEGNHANTGGAVSANKTDITISDTTLKKNTASNGGALFLASSSLTIPEQNERQNGTLFEGNTAVASGGAIYAQTSSTISLGKGTRFEGNQAGKGGAIYALQGTLDMTDTLFRHNSSTQKGGAIFLQGGSLNFNVTRTSLTPAISGNTSAAGGFLHLTGKSSAVFNIDQTRQLQIGDASYSGPDKHMDSLFIDATSSLKKTGGGELKINSSMEEMAGAVSVEDGTLSVSKHWNIRNSVTVTGGILDASSFSLAGDNASLTIGGGTLLTDTSHIFGTALNPDGTNGDTGKLKEHIDFSSGLISFNDAKYNLQYAGSAADILGVSKSSGKEIIFTGALYDNSGNASFSVSINDLNSSGLSNMVLGGTTLTTGTDPTGKNLVVGAADGSQFGGADAIDGSIGGDNLNLGTDGSAVTITGGQYLTLLGGETGTSLIEAGNDGKKAVDVSVGVAGGGAATAGTLNLGTAGLASGSTLTGNVRISDSGVMNVRAGEHSITGESDSTGQPVAGINNHGGTLNIAEQAILQTSVKQTTGETSVAGKLASSSVELEGGNFRVSGTAQIGQLIQHDGNTAISGTLQSDSLEIAGGSMSVTGTLKTDSLVVSNGMGIAVGDGSAAGKLSSSSTTLNGGGIFLDPVWLGNDTIETASHGALVFKNQTVDGQLTVGRNSLLVLGETSTGRSIDLFNTSGLKWGKDDISAALSITAPQYLSPAQGAIIVDGARTSAPTSPLTPNTATFANGSLLIVDASGLNGNAALASDNNGTLDVAEKASLLIGNATAGKYIITTGFTGNANVMGWEGDYLASTDQLIGLTIDKSEQGTIKVEAKTLEVTNTLPGVAIPGIISEIWGGAHNNTDSSNAGVAFLSRTMDKRYLAPNDTVRTINGAAQIAIAAGVQASAVAASGSVNRALQNHLSLGNSINRHGTPSLDRAGPDLWASMLYRDSDSSGIRAGRFSAGYQNDFGGIVAGADYTWKDISKGSIRTGGAMNIGKGDGKSRGDFSDTRNDYDTYGLSAYGSWNSGNANLMVDIGYMKGKNELKQTLPSTLGGTLKADADTQVWTIGTQGEYRLKTAAFDVTPHIGVRWLRLKTGAFSTYNSQGTVFQTGSDTQNIWQIPVGVTLSRDYVARNGWTIKPELDIAFIAATGDRNASTRIHVPGITASDVTRTEMMDSTSWNGSLGVIMQKDRLGIGFDAAYQKSGNEKSRGFMLKINRQFD